MQTNQKYKKEDIDAILNEIDSLSSEESNQFTDLDPQNKNINPFTQSQKTTQTGKININKKSKFDNQSQKTVANPNQFQIQQEKLQNKQKQPKKVKKSIIKTKEFQKDIQDELKSLQLPNSEFNFLTTEGNQTQRTNINDNEFNFYTEQNDNNNDQQQDDFDFYNSSDNDADDYEQFFQQQQQLLAQQQPQSNNKNINDLSDINNLETVNSQYSSSQKQQSPQNLNFTNKKDKKNKKDLIEDIINEIEQEEEMEQNQESRLTYQMIMQDIYQSDKFQDIDDISDGESSISLTESEKQNKKFKKQYQEKMKQNKSQVKTKGHHNLEIQTQLAKQNIVFITNEQNNNSLNFDENQYQNPLTLIDTDEQNAMYKSNLEQTNQEFEKELILNKIQSEEYHKNMFFYPQEQISYTCFQEQYGVSKCLIGITDKLIAVGTTKSIILVFDYFNPRNVNIIGQDQSQLDKKQQGCVTCIAVSQDATVLVAGYEFGDIIFWNLQNFTQIKKINGIHEQAILHIKFRFNNNNDQIISTDSKGNVFLLSIKKVFWSWTLDQQRLLPKSQVPFYDIQQLNCKQIDRNNQIQNQNFQKVTRKLQGIQFHQYEIISLISAEQVLILTLQPTVRLIHKFLKPKQVRLGSLPQIAFQFYNPIEYNQNSLFPTFVLSWGSLIRVYQFKESIIKFLFDGTKEESELVQCISHTVSDHSCVFMNFISQDMILHINTRKQIKLFYIPEFIQEEPNLDKIENIIFKKENKNYQKSIKYFNNLQHNLDFQSYIHDKSDQSFKTTYNNTISCFTSSNDVFVLCDKQIYKGHLNRWQETVHWFIKSNKWNDALKLCSQLYHKNVTLFSNQPKTNEPEGLQKYEALISDILKVFMEQNSKKFIECQNEGQEVDFMWRQLTITAIEFCINIQNFNLLFKDVRNFFFMKEKHKLFLASLEYFIINGQIKQVGTQIFREIIIFYKEKNKMHVLQQFIMGLDIESIEMGFTIPFCLDNKLYTPLTYICAKKNDDFITPLYKMFQEYQILQNEILENKDTQDTLIQKNMKLNKKKQKTLLYKCMWFIRNTFKGIIFPNEVIEDSRRQTVIRQIIVWIFVPEIHLPFAIEDSSVFLDLMYDLYRNPFLKNYLKQYDEHLYSYFQIQNNTNNKEKQEPQLNILPKIILNNIKDILKEEMKTNEVLNINFAILVSKICQDKDNKNHVSIDLCAETVKIIYKYQSNLPIPEQILSISKKEEMIMQILELKELELLENQQLVAEIIKICEEVEQLDPTCQIQFDISMAYLSYLEGSNLKAYNMYLLLAQRNNRVFDLFRWLQLSFQNNPKFVQEFAENYIIENIKELLMLNSNLTKNFVVANLKHKINEIQEVLSEYPPLLLDFIEQLLEDRNKEKFDPEILLTYISLLCKFSPEKVINEFQMHESDYNINQVIELCKLNDSVEPLAYLYKKQENYINLSCIVRSPVSDDSDVF